MRFLAKLTLTVIMCLAGVTAFSQCYYVVTKDAKVNKISIPCDFPVKLSAVNPVQDKSNFENAVLNWKAANPTLKDLKLIPKSHPDTVTIEIPGAAFNAFPADKQQAIKGFSYFYKIVF